MKKRIKWILSIVAVIIIGIGTVSGYRRINREFPKSKVTEIKKGEKGEFQKEVMISLVDSEIFTEEQSNVIYEQLKETLYSETRIIKTVFLLENLSDEKKEIELTSLTLESRGFSNGIHPMFGEIVEGSSAIQELEPGESKEISYYYDILSTGFSQKDWEKIEEREFWVTYRLYPEKRMIKLQ